MAWWVLESPVWTKNYSRLQSRAYQGIGLDVGKAEGFYWDLMGLPGFTVKALSAQGVHSFTTLEDSAWQAGPKSARGAGRTPGPGMWGRSMRTPQINGYEPPATPLYHHSNMRTPSVHTQEPGYRDPSMTPASLSALNGSAGPHASAFQVIFQHACVRQHQDSHTC